MNLPRLTIRNIEVVPVIVPLKYVLGTSAGAVRAAPLLLLDLHTHEGVTGHAYQFCYCPAAAPAVARFLDDIIDAVKDHAVIPTDLWALLAKRYMLIGVEGIVRMAMSLLDVAGWDALSKAANKPLAHMLGSEIRPIPAYNSCGLGLMPASALADEAERLMEGGFRGVKVRLGYPTLEEDVAAVRAVRRRIPGDAIVMVDYNQALSRDEATRRGLALDEEELAWIEEPIRHDDFSGCAALARALTTPVQIGENFSQVHDMQKAIDARACDLVMPDLERIGGVTGWQQASRLAEETARPMSSHLYPEVSAHLLCATPTAHWLEYVDWMNPLLIDPLKIIEGMAVASSRPGLGLEWDREVVRKYATA